MPTAKLGVCDIKIVTAYPDKIKVKRSTENKSRSSVLFLKTPKNLSARKFFAELFFKKGRQCRQPNSGIATSNLKLHTPTA